MFLKQNNKFKEIENVGVVRIQLTNQDLNNINTNGFYYSNGNDTCTNKPTSDYDNTYWILKVEALANNRIIQYFSNINYDRIWYRVYSGTAWGSWHEMALTEQITAIQDVIPSGASSSDKLTLASDVANLIKKGVYYGPQSIDIVYNGRMAMIYSSEYADSAGCYMLLSNYNQVGTLVKLGGGNNFSVSLTHKSNGVDTATIDIQENYRWTVIYL